jgi:ribosomal protein S18 acetylase RimI-like enzyme
VLVERALGRDVAGVMEIVTHCIRGMRSKGIYQWDDVYPNSTVFESDARAGSLYVIRQTGACVAAVCLNEEQPEEYGRLPWRYRFGRALVIHRLCVHPQWQKQGLAARLLAFAEEHAAGHGYAAIRFDAYSGNPHALALYERHGYERVSGTIHFPRRELPFYCYEKVVDATASANTTAS